MNAHINLSTLLTTHLPRHPGNIFLDLFDLVNDLRGSWF